MKVSGRLHTPASLPPEKGPQLRIKFEAGWVPKPVWKFGEEKISCPCQESRHDPQLPNP
jgi:hypothetical protein